MEQQSFKQDQRAPNEVKLRARPFSSAHDALSSLVSALQATIPGSDWLVARVDGLDSSILYASAECGQLKHGGSLPVNGILSTWTRRPLLRDDGGVLGVLFATQALVLTPAQTQLLDALSRTASTLLGIYLKEEAARQHSSQGGQAEADRLTNLGTREAWERALAQEDMALAVLGQNALVLRVELLELAEISNRFGLKTSDAFLKKTAKVLRHHFRESDVLCRVSDGVFGIVVRGAPSSAAAEVAARTAEALEGAHLTARVGYATRLASGSLAAAYAAAGTAHQAGMPASVGLPS